MCCLSQSSVEHVCSRYEGCKGDIVFDRTKSLDFDQTVTQINMMLQDVAESLRIHGNQKFLIYFDINDQEYYGDRSVDLCTGSKPKNSTSYFNRYATASIVLGSLIFPIYFKPIRKEDSVRPYDLVKELVETLESRFPVDRLLADGAFCTSDIVHYLEEKGVEFIFNMRSHKAVTDHIKRLRRTYMQTSDHIEFNAQKFYKWLKQTGQEYTEITTSYKYNPDVTFRVVLRAVLKKKKNQKNKRSFIVQFYTYCSNMRASRKYISKIYGRRWGVETYYRVIDRFKGYTTSPASIPRILLYGIGIVLVALWLRLNGLLNALKKGKILYFVVMEQFPVFTSYILLITGLFFCELLQDKWCRRR